MKLYFISVLITLTIIISCNEKDDEKKNTTDHDSLVSHSDNTVINDQDSDDSATDNQSTDADTAAEPVEVEKVLVDYNTNCYLLGTKKEVIIFDPGADSEKIIKSVGARTVTHIIMTHGHFDHITALDDIVSKYPEAKVSIHKRDVDYLYDYELNLSYHYIKEKYEFQGTVDIILQENDTISFAGKKLKVLNISGHTDGSCAFYIESDNIVFTGDTLMNMKIGYADYIPGAAEEILKKNITEKLFSLPDDTLVFPGHGPDTTIGFEKENNPIFK